MIRRPTQIDLEDLLGAFKRLGPMSGVSTPMGGYVGPRTMMLKPPVGGSSVKPPPKPNTPKK